jgi:transcriptional regulator with XRE-family HTH domain
MTQPADESVIPSDPAREAQQPQQPFGTAANPRVSLGERLRAARYAAQLTQQDLAGGAFSKSYISAVERGKMTPSIQALRFLTGRLGVSLSYLLGEQDDEPNAIPQQERLPGETHWDRQLDEAEKLLMRSNPDAALEHLGEQEAVAELDTRRQAHWSWLYGWALGQQGRDQEALAVLEHGLEAAQANQDCRFQGHFHFTLASIHVARGEHEAAEQSFRQAINCGERIKYRELLDCLHEQYAEFLAARGRFQEAYEHLSLVPGTSPHSNADN